MQIAIENMGLCHVEIFDNVQDLCSFAIFGRRKDHAGGMEKLQRLYQHPMPSKTFNFLLMNDIFFDCFTAHVIGVNYVLVTHFV